MSEPVSEQPRRKRSREELIAEAVGLKMDEEAIKVLQQAFDSIGKGDPAKTDRLLRRAAELARVPLPEGWLDGQDR